MSQKLQIGKDIQIKTMRTCKYIVECSLHVGGVQGGGLYEAEVVLLSEDLGLVCGDGSQVTQVRLVSHLERVNIKQVFLLKQLWK